jgi:hypothetical protein
VKSTNQGDDLDLVIDAFQARLAAVTDAHTQWAECSTNSSAPMSSSCSLPTAAKGLEYHTVFFLGLDDHQWWAYDRDPGEANSTFFVGLSRAAQRMIFTITMYGRTTRVDAFFTVLDHAGVPKIDKGQQQPSQLPCPRACVGAAGCRRSAWNCGAPRTLAILSNRACVPACSKCADLRWSADPCSPPLSVEQPARAPKHGNVSRLLTRVWVNCLTWRLCMPRLCPIPRKRCLSGIVRY